MRTISPADHEEPHVFHSSLRLFSLAEPDPQPDKPDWAQTACWPHAGVEHLMTFLSPLDASIEQHYRNQDGRRYGVCPFVSVHPQHFLETHDHTLNVAIVYGYAAHQGRIITYVDSTFPAPLILSKRFPIPLEAGCSFHLEWGDAHDMLAGIHAAAGLPAYAETVDALTRMTPDVVSELAGKALRQIESPWRHDEATEFAIYDTSAQRWRFTDMDWLRPHGLA